MDILREPGSSVLLPRAPSPSWGQALPCAGSCGLVPSASSPLQSLSTARLAVGWEGRRRVLVGWNRCLEVSCLAPSWGEVASG